MHVAWFARRAAFSLMYVVVMFMLHARAVRLCTLSVLMWSSLFLLF